MSDSTYEKAIRKFKAARDKYQDPEDALKNMAEGLIALTQCIEHDLAEVRRAADSTPPRDS